MKTKNKISRTDVIKQLKILHRKVGRRPKKRDNPGLYSRSRKFFGSWNNLMRKAGYPVRYYQKPSLPKLGSSLAYFVGLLSTDGHIQYDNRRKKYKVAIYTSYKDEKEMIIGLMKKLFNYDASVTSRMYGFNKKPNFEVRISSRFVADYLITQFEIPPGPKSLSVRVPQRILTSQLNILYAYVRGVIDGDGSITKYGIKISSGSEKFVNDMKFLLSTLNISSGKTKKSKNSRLLEFCISKKDVSKLKIIYDQSPYHYSRKKKAINNI